MPPPADVTPAAVEPFELVLSRGVILFCDRAGVPCLKFPGDSTRRTWPLRSDRVQAWIVWTFKTATNRILKKSEVMDTLRALEGQAYENRPEDSDDDQLWRRFEDEPALQATYDFMRGKPRWEGRTEDLFTEVRKVANERNINLYSTKWPTIPRLLSAKLNRYRDVLRQAGIAVEITHCRDGSHTTLENVACDAGDGNSTPASPPANSQTLAPTQRDAGDVGDAGNQGTDETPRRICELLGSSQHNAISGGSSDGDRSERGN